MEWLVGYAFEGKGLHHLSLGVFEVNKRAMALYDKVWVLFVSHFNLTGFMTSTLWQWVYPRRHEARGSMGRRKMGGHHMNGNVGEGIPSTSSAQTGGQTQWLNVMLLMLASKKVLTSSIVPPKAAPERITIPAHFGSEYTRDHNIGAIIHMTLSAHTKLKDDWQSWQCQTHWNLKPLYIVKSYINNNSCDHAILAWIHVRFLFLHPFLLFQVYILGL